jgi:pimeloyl-ACP methyl ester carboxylesterase
MPTITTTDGVNIFYKDWGSGQPIVFSHGWPLSADDWDAQMTFFLRHGYRVIAHDRRGHGRSDQPSTGNDMDHWVADLAALTEHLDLRDAIHIGHSTGGGEVARYVARHQERVAKAVLVASLTPNMYRSEDNPSGQPPEWFEAIRAGVLGNRAEFFRFVPERGQAFGGSDRELVAPRHGRRCPRSLRDCRLLARRLYRRPQEDHRAGAGDAWRG